MKKILYIFLFLFLTLPLGAHADEVNMYLFYGDGCPHCAALEKYLESEYGNDKDLKLYRYEVWNSNSNVKLWEKVQNALDEEAKGVPYFVVGDQVVQGFMEGATEKKIDKVIKNARDGNFNDNASIALGIKDGKIKKSDKSDKPNYDPDKKETDLNNNTSGKDENFIDVPLIGKVNLANLSIPVIAVVIGLVDGFNPCAMWILIFLITMLFDYKDRKKMWILGGTFLFTSAFIYFLFMISFLNIAMFINSIKILKIGIALFALCFGIINIYRYFKTKDAGCDVVDKKKRKKLMIRIKSILENKKFLFSLIGIIILAISVNLIELLCSLGLPVMFTEILAHNNITGARELIYIIIYVIFFLLDDLIVFFIAMKTLKITAISNKYTKYSHLIGGLIMLIIGLLMIFKPEWLMFNF
ncbi:MAG: hypothetical protein Q4C29_01250 [bacterium]|nr:hypothetical protein [bacterium]